MYIYIYEIGDQVEAGAITAGDYVCVCVRACVRAYVLSWTHGRACGWACGCVFAGVCGHACVWACVCVGGRAHARVGGGGFGERAGGCWCVQ